jgi:hypothetical protein
VNLRLKKRLWGVLVLLLLAGLVSACGSSAGSATQGSGNTSTPTAAPSINLDACTLVTAQEMSKIVGTTVTAQSQTLSNGDPSCSYKPISGALQPSILLGVHKDGENYYSSAQSLYTGTPGYKLVSGVGDQAFDSGQGTFYTLKGTICIDVVIIQNPKVRSAQLKEIAVLAVGRLR